MPLTETLQSFFGGEYERFMRGLDGLTQTERDAQLRSTRRSRQNAAQPKLVEIPGWSDVVHIRPRLDITAAQRSEYYQARRAGRAERLPPEVVREIERRRGRADAMQRSAQPEFDRAWGSVMTAIDNVQDFLAAVSVFGRIALSIAGRIGLRFVPGLGPLILAADILSWAMFLGTLAFPLWLNFCAGPRAALRAGLGSAITAGAFKGTSALLARGSASSLRWTGRPGLGVRGITGLIGSALVIGQTTDSLFGYGLSLGPIVGATMGAAYGLEAIARGESVEVRQTPSAEHFWPRVRGRLREVPTAALYERIAAAAVIEQAALVLAASSPATDEERLLTVAAIPPAVQVLAADWQGTGWQADLPRLAGWSPPPPPLPAIRPRWSDFLPVDAPPMALGWPIAWGGSHYDPSRAALALPGAVSAGVSNLTQGLGNPTEQAFIGAAVTDAAEALWLFWEGPEADLRPALTPAWLAAERMAAVGFLPHPGNELDRTQRWWDAAIARVENSKHGLMTLTEWIQLSELHQLDYIVVRPPALIE
jgi:hypothetical protein